MPATAADFETNQPSRRVPFLRRCDQCSHSQSCAAAPGRAFDRPQIATHHLGKCSVSSLLTLRLPLCQKRSAGNGTHAHQRPGVDQCRRQSKYPSRLSVSANGHHQSREYPGPSSQCHNVD